MITEACVPCARTESIRPPSPSSPMKLCKSGHAPSPPPPPPPPLLPPLPGARGQRGRGRGSLQESVRIRLAIREVEAVDVVAAEREICLTIDYLYFFLWGRVPQRCLGLEGRARIRSRPEHTQSQTSVGDDLGLEYCPAIRAMRTCNRIDSRSDRYRTKQR